ncbi:NAD-P-binding protein [Guyanagaster necrorhizus]|uniref:NAD-P-binding protein n=1 Tax=Guyanagaster necrorhizus TaxID=856835 RepID=A0A9P7W5X2_9AGAR|nr:NAD-P-binding protein [Guyanagaster necrorhizus MCA 3950]KAG7451856.1 NAD-P-binding protein [Guyanagaster necrorhizus MCA 3950]
MVASLVWIITGTSSGIGRELAFAALRRGDKVIATGRRRSFDKLDDLRKAGANTLELDVTASPVDLAECARKAIEMHGRIDVLVNNAGSYLTCGAAEELTPEETYDQFNVHLFGALNVARAFLPYMRERKSGMIVWIGSLCGWQGSAALSMYVGVKHAVRGISESMDMEVSPLGIRSINIEPGYFQTKIVDPNNRSPYVDRIEDYRPMIGAINDICTSLDGNQRGDTRMLVEIIVDVVKGQGVASGKVIPRSLQIGPDCYDAVKQDLTERLQVLESWKDVIISTDLPVEPRL